MTKKQTSQPRNRVLNSRIVADSAEGYKRRAGAVKGFRALQARVVSLTVSER